MSLVESPRASDLVRDDLGDDTDFTALIDIDDPEDVEFGFPDDE